MKDTAAQVPAHIAAASPAAAAALQIHHNRLDDGSAAESSTGSSSRKNRELEHPAYPLRLAYPVLQHTITIWESALQLVTT